MNSVIQTKERQTMKQFKVGDWVTINWHQEENHYQIIDIWEGNSTDKEQEKIFLMDIIIVNHLSDNLLLM